MTDELNYAQCVEPVEIKYGENLKELFTSEELLNSLQNLRKAFFKQYGIRLNVINLTPDALCKKDEYQIYFFGVFQSNFTLKPGSVMFLNLKDVEDDKTDALEIDFEKTHEPAFGISGVWVKKGDAKIAEQKGFKLVSDSKIISVHLEELLKNNLEKFITTQTVKEMCKDLRKTDSELIKRLTQYYDFNEIKKYLYTLLEEKVSIKNLRAIFEILVDFRLLKDDFFYVLSKIRKTLISQILGDKAERGDGTEVHGIALGEKISDYILKHQFFQKDGDSYICFENLEIRDDLFSKLSEKIRNDGIQFLIVHDGIRRSVWNSLHPTFQHLAIISVDEAFYATTQTQFLQISELIDVDIKENPKKRQSKNKLKELSQSEIEKIVMSKAGKLTSLTDFSNTFNPSLKIIEENVGNSDVILVNKNQCAVGLFWRQGLYEPVVLFAYWRNAVTAAIRVAQQKGIRIVETPIAAKIFKKGMNDREVICSVAKCYSEFDFS